MTDELQFFRDEVLGKLGYSDEDSEIDPLEYVRTEIRKMQARIKDMGQELQELRKVRAENERLKAEVAKLLDWQIRVLQTMDNCRTGDCSCGTDEDCQSLFREATEKGGE